VVGLKQLERYLTRVWRNAGFPPQLHEDCTQSVLVALLLRLGRDRFDVLLTLLVSHKAALAEPEFFRTIATVRKRFQRLRRPDQFEDNWDTPQVTRPGPAFTFADIPARALARLHKRESMLFLILAEGWSVKEAASRLGISCKTASSTRTRIIRKLSAAIRQVA
jgi:DNA-binding CsgD family transcriptional regulator